MLRKIVICLALAGTPQFAAAQSVQDQIVSQLRAQGFSEITLQRTWLGRVRVIAKRDDLRRELVFDPQTGEILRDYWREDNDDGPRLFNPGGSNSAGSSSERDDDDDDDDDDDAEEQEDDIDEDDDDDDDEEDGEPEQKRQKTSDDDDE